MAPSRLYRRHATPLDIIDVASEMSERQQRQIKALGGNTDPQELAINLCQISLARVTIATLGMDTPLAVGGYVHAGTITQRSWFFSKPVLFKQYEQEALAEIRAGMAELAEKFSRCRLETLCLADAPKKVMDYHDQLGLVKEAEFIGYGMQGEDVVVFSRLFETGQISNRLGE